MAAPDAAPSSTAPTRSLEDQRHVARYWLSPDGVLETQTCYSRAWGDAVRQAVPQAHRTWHRDRQAWRFDAAYAGVVLDLMREHFTDIVVLDAPPTRPRRPMTEARAWGTLCLLPTAPLALIEAAYRLFSVGASVERQLLLDEAARVARREGWRDTS